MVRLGPYKQVFEAHRGSFLRAGCSDVGASALAQAAVAKPLTESALGRPARYFASAIPHATDIPEFDQPEHCYSPVSSKWKIWAMGKVNDEGSWSLRAAIAGLKKPIPNDSRGSSGTTGSNVTEKKLPNILSLSCVHSSEATPWNFNWLILLG